MAKSLLSVVRSYLGTPYVFGGSGRNGIDCSGLVMKAYAAMGVKLPHLASAQQTMGSAVNGLNNARPGDLVFFGKPAYHVAMYLGDNKIIEAPQPGVPVHIVKLYQAPSSIRRFKINGQIGDSGGEMTGSAVSAETGLTAADYQAAAGDAGAAITHIPELKHLLDQAKAGDWSTEKFENAVESSHWYRDHSDTARSVIAQQYNDPATFHQHQSQVGNTVANLANTLGMPLDSRAIGQIANAALMTGNDSNTQWLTQQVAARMNYAGLKNLNGLRGQMAATTQQLQETAMSYGYQPTAQGLATAAWNVLRGKTTTDTYTQQWKQYAMSTFPGLAKQIEAGATVKDLADPYINSMSDLLETDGNAITLFNPAIRAALQGSVDPNTKQRESTPLWKFEQQMRSDPRWQYTDNAKDSMSSLLVKLGQDWGFGT